MTVLVVGSTGVVGRQICRLLAEGGHRVRGLVRQSSDPAVIEALETHGVEAVVGDLTSPATVEAACADVEAVVSTATAIGSAASDADLEAVDQDGHLSLIDAAVAAGVARFVFVAVLDLPPRSPFAAARVRVEEHLRASGRTFTIVRPTIYMDTWLSPDVGFDWASGRAVIYGPGTAPLAWVYSGDVAEVVAAAVFDPLAHDAEVTVLGPEALTPDEVVATFEAVTGRRFEVTHVPVEALEAQLASTDDPIEQSFAVFMLRYAAGDPSDARPVAGLPATHTTVEQYARRLTTAHG